MQGLDLQSFHAVLRHLKLHLQAAEGVAKSDCHSMPKLPCFDGSDPQVKTCHDSEALWKPRVAICSGLIRNCSHLGYICMGTSLLILSKQAPPERSRDAL